MLILTRKAGEVMRIGDNIVLSVLEVGGSQVRIGIEAPKDVSVHREEIYQRIQRSEPFVPKEVIPLQVSSAAPIPQPGMPKKPPVQIKVVKRRFV